MEITRRDFLKASTAVAGALGVGASGLIQLSSAQAANNGSPPIIWLQAQNCTGCSISLLNTIYYATIDNLLTNVLNLEFHPNLMADAGERAVAGATLRSIQGGHILVVEGAIPTGANGAYCELWRGTTALSAVKSFGEKAKFIMAVGSCASYGGLPAGGENPTEAKGLRDILTNKPIVNVPGCPAHPDWIVGTIAYLLKYNRLPELDSLGRPTSYYSTTVHDNCPRLDKYKAGKFAKTLGDPTNCLHDLGCRGWKAKSDCPSRKWNSAASGAVGVNWCIGGNAPCSGCVQPDFADAKSQFYILDASQAGATTSATKKTPTTAPSSTATNGGTGTSTNTHATGPAGTPTGTTVGTTGTGSSTHATGSGGAAAGSNSGTTVSTSGGTGTTSHATGSAGGAPAPAAPAGAKVGPAVSTSGGTGTTTHATGAPAGGAAPAPSAPAGKAPAVPGSPAPASPGTGSTTHATGAPAGGSTAPASAAKPATGAVTATPATGAGTSVAPSNGAKPAGTAAPASTSATSKKAAPATGIGSTTGGSAGPKITTGRGTTTSATGKGKAAPAGSPSSGGGSPGQKSPVTSKQPAQSPAKTPLSATGSTGGSGDKSAQPRKSGDDRKSEPKGRDRRGRDGDGDKGKSARKGD